MYVILFTLGYFVGRIAITLFDWEIKTLSYLKAVVYAFMLWKVPSSYSSHLAATGVYPVWWGLKFKPFNLLYDVDAL